MDDRDPALVRIQGAAKLDFLARDPNVPGVGPVDAAQDLDAGALPGSVLADQAEHLPRVERQRDILERHRSLEDLRDAP
jgi:hypothetical protein